MLTLSPAPVKDSRPAYRPFTASVARLERLSPHFVRVTFTGDDLGGFGADRLDQRLKIVFPLEHTGMSDFGATDPATITEGSWYSRWRALPDDARNPFRTYTVRAVRQQEREVDVDMVSHGDGGPASRWLNRAQPGDEVVLVGPDARSIHSAIGIDWHPGDARRVLLVGDETAAPAICSVLESLPTGRTAHAFIEIPTGDDVLPVDVPPGSRITWLPRGNAPIGTALGPAVRTWVTHNRPLYRAAISSTAQRLDDVDVDRELIWDSPEAQSTGDFYAWLAGEAGVIKSLRRFLVSETGIDRKRIAFMGYWRAGKAEAQ
ncbi:NADPH-dependent ferric siderophore reductase [Mycetocola sp. CAN_C7]|uniref:siderophore-interacting protein n=1 Tax=Mycetocola sp. CAN_C7 TaxID=2787724 RepID=UPI0018CBBAA5